MDLSEFERFLNGRTRTQIPSEGRPIAAVLIGLFGPAPDHKIVYTVRTSHVEHHKGEISFPGGGKDPEDATLVETALRESYEEVGIEPKDVTILGLMDDIVTRSKFVVTPVVAYIERHPYPFVAQPREVEKVLEVPLSHLRDPRNLAPHPDDPTGQRIKIQSYRFGEHMIWGATAHMTARFLNLLNPRR